MILLKILGAVIYLGKIQEQQSSEDGPHLITSYHGPIKRVFSQNLLK
jgi:hypothetical protein